MTERDISKGFLGTGFKFPIQVDPNTGRMRTSSHEEDIKEAIGIILNTRKGVVFIISILSGDSGSIPGANSLYSM
jgi:hypothetical protein